MIRLEAADRRRVLDFLSRPPSAAAWDTLRGPAYLFATDGHQPAEPHSLDEVLDEGRDDIGREEPTLDELPPEPGEPTPGMLHELGRRLRRASQDHPNSLRLAVKASRPAKPPGPPRWQRCRQARHVLEAGQFGAAEGVWHR